MNNEYYMNDDEGGSSRDAENKLPWYQKIRGRIKPIFTNPMFFTFIILFIIVAFVIYWYYVRPKWYKKIFRILLLFEGFNTLIWQAKKLRPQKINNLLHQLEILPLIF